MPAEYTTLQSMTVEYESRVGAIVNWFTTVCCPSHALRKWGTEGFNNGLVKHLKKKEDINATVKKKLQRVALLIADPPQCNSTPLIDKTNLIIKILHTGDTNSLNR